MNQIEHSVALVPVPKVLKIIQNKQIALVPVPTVLKLANMSKVALVLVLNYCNEFRFSYLLPLVTSLVDLISLLCFV